MIGVCEQNHVLVGAFFGGTVGRGQPFFGGMVGGAPLEGQQHIANICYPTLHVNPGVVGRGTYRSLVAGGNPGGWRLPAVPRPAPLSWSQAAGITLGRLPRVRAFPSDGCQGEGHYPRMVAKGKGKGCGPGGWHPGYSRVRKPHPGPSRSNIFRVHPALPGVLRPGISQVHTPG